MIESRQQLLADTISRDECILTNKNYTIMNYKEKNKKALERARKLIDKGYNVLMSEIFPELIESEDEKIGKAAIEFVKDNYSFKAYNKISKEKVIAWLEKQKDTNQQIIVLQDKIDSLHAALKAQELRKIPTPGEWSEEDKKHLNDVIREIQANFDADEMESTEYYKKLVDWLKSLRPAMPHIQTSANI